MRIPLLAGRYLDDHDIDGLPVVINEILARRFLPGQNAVGHRLLIGVTGTTPRALPIVGVVADTRDLGLAALSEPEIYFAGFGSSLVVRTANDPMKLAGALRHEVMAVDREQPITAVRTMDEIVDQELAGRRFSVRLIGLFAALALALAAIGLYGVVSYSVAHRTQEMGLRMALGASKWNVIGMVLGEALKLTLAGLIVGATMAVLATRFLKGQLFGITPDDPETFLIAAVTLLAVVMAGTYVPARRATQVDPAVALRAE